MYPLTCGKYLRTPITFHIYTSLKNKKNKKKTKQHNTKYTYIPRCICKTRQTNKNSKKIRVNLSIINFINQQKE